MDVFHDIRYGLSDTNILVIVLWAIGIVCVVIV